MCSVVSFVALRGAMSRFSSGKKCPVGSAVAFSFSPAPEVRPSPARRSVTFPVDLSVRLGSFVSTSCPCLCVGSLCMPGGILEYPDVILEK